jgi:hypothetical protein
MHINESQVCLCKNWASDFYLITFVAWFSSENLEGRDHLGRQMEDNIFSPELTV